MDKTVSIEIPAPPDGIEIVQSGVSMYGDFALVATVEGFRWKQVPKGGEYVALARKKSTLADWANKQRLFQALAQILKAYSRKENSLSMQSETWDHGQWTFSEGNYPQVVFYPHLEIPPANLTGKLRLDAGKWVDA